MITTVIILSLSLLLASVAFQFAERRLRKSRLNDLILKPNCLLTRYPIAFLSGPRTVFRLFDHWNAIPLFLREHGYEVYVIEPSGRATGERVGSVRAAIEQLGRCHLVADGSLERDLELIASYRLQNVASITCVKTMDRERFNRLQTGTPSAHELRPSLIETFDVKGTPVHGLTSAARLTLLAAHNFLIKRRTLFVHPFETAELSNGFSSEERFLDLAISLAERDVIGSD